jgi:hypothetical protein
VITAAATTPADQSQVLCALRLGWAFSELRGRLRPGEKLVKIEPASGALRAEHALPLGGERTEPEQLIEAEAVVVALAERLQLDLKLSELTGQPKSKELTKARLEKLSKALRADGEQAWDETAKFLYAWDAKMQDELAGAGFAVASAYQLGRGLGEIAWLDPTKSAADDATSWTFVLGDRRVRTLERLVKRLAAYFQPFTAAGVASSLVLWGSVAGKATQAPSDNVRACLLEQTRRWRDLLLTGLDPTTLLSRTTLVARARQLRQVLRSFWLELTVGGVSALAAATGAALLATKPKSHFLAAFVGVLGAFGFTASGALARAKSQAQALIDQLRAAVDADLVEQAVVVPPPAPDETTRRGSPSFGIRTTHIPWPPRP